MNAIALELTPSQEWFAHPKEFKQQIQDFFTQTLNRWFNDGQIQVELSKGPQYKTMAPLLKRYGYSDLRHAKVMIPVGLSVTYLEYLDALSPSVAICETLSKRMLEPANRYLGQVLSDPEKLNQLRGVHHEARIKPANVDQQLTQLEACFNAQSTQISAPLGDVFKRNQDIKTVFDQAAALNERMLRSDLNAVQTQTETLIHLYDRLIDRIQEEELDIEARAMERLSQMTYTLAQEVEFYGMICYQLTALTQALNETAFKLKETL